jgi:hypothetical protein
MENTMQLPISKEVSDEGCVSIVDASGDPWFEGTGFGTEGAAADLIVRAVNSHEQLVDLLKAADNKLHAMHHYHSGAAAAAIHGLREKIAAALAAAEAA